jgi:hypothetical protein
VTELKHFRFDPAHTDPRTIAQIDKREFVIERIVAHRGDLRRKGTLEFCVRWEGYSEQYDLWLPWKELMHTEQLRTYLLQSDELKRLLPKSLRK